MSETVWVIVLLAAIITLGYLASGDETNETEENSQLASLSISVNVTDHPYLVSMFYKEETLCFGTLISEKFILTAAHRVDSATDLDEIQVFPLARLWQAEKSGQNASEVAKIVLAVEKIHIYPEFESAKNDPKKQGHKNNIALVELKEPTDVEPVELYEGELVPGTVAKMIGCGDAEMQENLLFLKLDMPIVDRQRCNKAYSGIDKIQDDQFCAGNMNKEKGQGTDESDHGIPLLVDGRMAGILLGYPNAENEEDDDPDWLDKPDVYTSVPYHRSWIEQIVLGLNKETLESGNSTSSERFDNCTKGYSYLVYMAYQRRRSNRTWVCMGTLITQKFVLTVADLVQNVTNLSEFEVFPLSNEKIVKNASGLSVTKIHVHPEIRLPDKAQGYKNNVALVELKDSTEIKPVEFVQEKVVPGILASLIGSGREGSENQSHLAWLDLQTVSLKKCQKAYSGMYRLGDDQFCGVKQGNLSRRGGSTLFLHGAPLLIGNRQAGILLGYPNIEDPADDSKWFDKPIVFVSVFHHREWINKVLPEPNKSNFVTLILTVIIIVVTMILMFITALLIKNWIEL